MLCKGAICLLVGVRRDRAFYRGFQVNQSAKTLIETRGRSVEIQVTYIYLSK